MKKSGSIKKICQYGHVFYKSSTCLTCPTCEKNNKPENGFLSLLSAPARRAFENNGLTTLKKLAACTEDEILKLHGVGKSSIPKLKAALKKAKLHLASAKKK